MTDRKLVTGIVAMLLGLPPAVVMTEAVSFYLANRTNRTIVSSGAEREYLLYIPRSYDSTRATPLVISMHGAAMWPGAQRETSRWNTVAEREGFIVVYPSGANGAGPRIWHVDRSGRLAADVRFIAALIDTLAATYNVDTTRVYADGLSNGGGMAFVLSCTLADRIAAVGMVASAQSLPWRWCLDQRPVPMIAIHGTADRVTPYHGGVSWPSPRSFPGIPRWAANWGRRNQCDVTPTDAVIAPDVARLEYTNCAHDAAVVLYTVRGGGHTWPGGKALPAWLLGYTSMSIDATSEMWKFFREHAVRAR